MTIIAQKKNNGRVTFYLPDKSEAEAIEYARNSIRKITKENFKKRLWGWTFKRQ